MYIQRVFQSSHQKPTVSSEERHTKWMEKASALERRVMKRPMDAGWVVYFVQACSLNYLLP
jgi:hypothetical protein